MLSRERMYSKLNIHTEPELIASSVDQLTDDDVDEQSAPRPIECC